MSERTNAVVWHVSFRYKGEWEWVGIEASHPAAAKKQVHERIGEEVTEWGYVTRTDAEQSIDMMLTIRSGRKLGKTIQRILSGGSSD